MPLALSRRFALVECQALEAVPGAGLLNFLAEVSF